jgi:predicted O-methyltransferase YrrM
MENITLKDITLFCVDCKNHAKAASALKESIKSINFGKLLFLSDKKPSNLDPRVKFIEIKPINSLHDYSKFILKELYKYIDTDLCMVVHHDGWIINPQNWKEDFLKYDYIGAPWPGKINDNSRVGNGGVSIRSKKLLLYTKDIEYKGGNEDGIICIQHRKRLESAGLKIAPLDVAKYFSIEIKCNDIDVSFNDVFAFHGKDYTDFHVQQNKIMENKSYKETLLSSKLEEIYDWLQNEAGCQDPNYFFGKFRGNLELQQVPNEYVYLLDFFRSSKIKSYLELGVGNGGSFFVNSLFLSKTCNKLRAVDNISYANTHIHQTEEKILKKIELLRGLVSEKCKIDFSNSSTDDFFLTNKEKYDCIFIDADHSYEGVKRDYENSLKALKKNGVLVFHDIGNDRTGVYKCWQEIKNNSKSFKEFLWKPENATSYNCGIGLYQT